MAAVTICSDFGAQKNKVWQLSTVSPFICHEVMRPDAMIFVCWMLSFKPAFPLSSFTFIKMLLSSSSLYAKRVISSAYLRLLIFLLAILFPACASSSPAFHMIYSACKLSRVTVYSLDILLSLFLNQSIVLCLALTVASWPAYRFCRRQVRWSIGRAHVWTPVT